MNYKPETGWLTRVPMAHRGLHDAEAGCIENTESAFAAAIEAGYGIECDIQVSSDGEAMVFHDAKLDRLTEGAGRLSDRSASELKAISFKDTADRMQTLEELLEQIDGRVPLLVEIKKTEKQPGALEERARYVIAKKMQEVAVMSFNPSSMGWFSMHAPAIPRGQLSTAYKTGSAATRPWMQRFLARHLFVNLISRPHFIGYDVKHLPAPATSFLRRMGKPILTWTVRTESDKAVAANNADNIIFEGFRPGLDWSHTRE